MTAPAATATTEPAFRVMCAARPNPVTFEDTEHDARAMVTAIETAATACRALHTVETRDAAGEWVPVHIARARAILAAPVGPRSVIETPDGPLIKMSGRWSAETAARANAAAPEGTPEWYAAMGPHEDATLTADGRGAVAEWCRD